MIKAGFPDFSDLPLSIPMSEWEQHCDRLVDLPRGLSRHPVVYVNYAGILYAVKELPGGMAEIEFLLLDEMEGHRLPVVSPVGYLRGERSTGSVDFLITRYLENSLPYRSLFMSNSLERYREHMLDSIAGLMVQLHLAGIYWGDCSLSNTLFRRDAGALQAYLVDAETAEIFPDGLSALSRFQDLQIMEENINGDVADLVATNLIAEGVPLSHTGAIIRQRYQRLWDEITREDLVNADENYKVEERIRALNELGFSIENIEFTDTGKGDQLRFRVVVSDRNFHHDLLQVLTGVDAQEQQARQIMNEIQQLKAILSRTNDRSTPLSVAASYWLENYYLPTIEKISAMKDGTKDLPEVYCQILEHKWFLSERAQTDVGHEVATEDYLNNIVKINT